MKTRIPTSDSELLVKSIKSNGGCSEVKLCPAWMASVLFRRVPAFTFCITYWTGDLSLILNSYFVLS